MVVVDFQTLSFPTLQMNCVWEELLNFRWQSSGHPPIDPAFVVLKSFQPFINMFRGQPEYVCMYVVMNSGLLFPRLIQILKYDGLLF